jgi:murein DD-endopeptidase MepM/ murein hydrolase activator NlpD
MMKEGKRHTRGLLGWIVLVAALAGLAYLAGTVLARRWMTPSLALPAETPSPEPQLTPAAPIEPGKTVEGRLAAEAVDEWQFSGQAGQSATVEMWFHPGSGSNVEAELVVRLIAPTGTVLSEKQGSVFLPPYLFAPSLPSAGLYQLQVSPLSGTPGRYSLSLRLSQGVAGATTEAMPDRTPMPQDGSPATVAAQFQWPTTRREISGWTFHDPNNPGHIGLDIAAEKWDPIVAVADGKIVFAEWGGGYGNLVIVAHQDDWNSYYAHLTEIAVEGGQEVRQGETLGGAGTTGYSTGPHLHFELRYQGRPVDPHVHLP